MVSLEDLHEHPKRSRMRVLARRPGSEFAELASVRVDDSRDGGRRWTPVEADLSAFAGERIVLRLELDPEVALEPGADLAWWGSPRVVAAPPRDGRAARAH
jgi:hypothetical protein